MIFLLGWADNDLYCVQTAKLYALEKSIWKSAYTILMFGCIIT